MRIDFSNWEITSVKVRVLETGVHFSLPPQLLRTGSPVQQDKRIGSIIAITGNGIMFCIR